MRQLITYVFFIGIPISRFERNQLKNNNISRIISFYVRMKNLFIFLLEEFSNGIMLFSSCQKLKDNAAKNKEL